MTSDSITLYDSFSGRPRYYVSRGCVYDYHGRSQFYIADWTCYAMDGSPVLHIGSGGWIFDIATRRPVLYCDEARSDELTNKVEIKKHVAAVLEAAVRAKAVMRTRIIN